MFGFNHCNFSGNSFIETSTSVGSGRNDVVVSSYGVKEYGKLFDVGPII
jgi:hypothetical protein